MLIVLSIIALAGAIIVPEITKMGSLQIQAASRIVIADLLYAQNEAIAHQSIRRVVFSPTTNSYQLTDGAGNVISATWKDASANNYTVSFKTDKRFNTVSLSKADFGGTTTVEFDPLGSPSAGGTVELTAQGLRYRIAVASFTGRVTVAPVTGGG
jgi:Tfp pilus assembly protein FimT